METVIFKSDSKKDMNLLINLAKKIGIEVKKVSSKKDYIDENDPAYELKVERNLGKIMDECRNSEIAPKEDLLNDVKKFK